MRRQRVKVVVVARSAAWTPTWTLGFQGNGKSRKVLPLIPMACTVMDRSFHGTSFGTWTKLQDNPLKKKGKILRLFLGNLSKRLPWFFVPFLFPRGRFCRGTPFLKRAEGRGNLSMHLDSGESSVPLLRALPPRFTSSLWICHSPPAFLSV